MNQIGLNVTEFVVIWFLIYRVIAIRISEISNKNLIDDSDNDEILKTLYLYY